MLQVFKGAYSRPPTTDSRHRPTLIETLLEGLLAQRLLPEDDIKRLFSNLDEIILANEAFLAALEEVNAREDVLIYEKGWGKAYADLVRGYYAIRSMKISIHPFRKRRS